MSLAVEQEASYRLPNGIVLFSDNEGLADTLSRIADGERLSGVETRPGGLEDALSCSPGKEEVILVDLSGAAPDMEALQVLSKGRKARIVAVGEDNDVRLLHRLRQIGIMDYLVHPVEEDELFDALHVPVSAGPTAASEASAVGPRTTVVVGCRGGVGATGFAVSAAWWSAEKRKCQTALIDLDVIFGTATLALDLMPGRGLREALENPERIDPLFVGSAMINASDNLFILGAEEQPSVDVRPTVTGMARLLEAVRDSVPCVFVDLPRQLLPSSEGLLADADELVLVTDLSLGGLRDAIRLKALCRSLAPNLATTLVAMLPSIGQPPVERKEFERAYEGAIDWLVPWEPKIASQIITEGKPLISGLKPKHPYSQAVQDVVSRAAPETAQTKKAKRKWLW